MSHNLLCLLAPVPPAEHERDDHEYHEGHDAEAEGFRDGEKLAPVLAEDVTDEGVDDGPDEGSRNVVGDEPEVPHPGDAGEEGRHAAQPGPKAADEHGLAAVGLEVALDLLEALLVYEEMEEPYLEDAVDEGPPPGPADPVHRVVRDERAREPAEHDQRERRLPVVGEEPAREQDYVPGGGEAEVVERGPQTYEEVSTPEAE